MSQHLSMGHRVFVLQASECSSAPTARDLSEQSNSRFYVTWLSSSAKSPLPPTHSREGSQTSSVTSEPDRHRLLADRTQRSRAPSVVDTRPITTRRYALVTLSTVGANSSGSPDQAPSLRLAKWESSSDGEEKWFSVRPGDPNRVGLGMRQQQSSLAPPPMDRQSSRRFSEPAALGASAVGSPNHGMSHNSSRRFTTFTDSAPKFRGAANAEFDPMSSWQRQMEDGLHEIALRNGLGGGGPGSGGIHHAHTISGRPNFVRARTAGLPSFENHHNQFESITSDSGMLSRPGMPRVRTTPQPQFYSNGDLHSNHSLGQSPTLWERRKQEQKSKHRTQVSHLDEPPMLDQQHSTISPLGQHTLPAPHGH